MLQIMWMLKKISIHASAKEATSNETIAKEVLADFNPRLREGGDRWHILCSQFLHLNFNPRLREGGDAMTVFAGI